MDIGIGEEVNIFFRAIMLGCAAGFCYDFLRILRRILKGKTIRVGIEDITFFIIFSLLMDVFLYYVNGGILRGYILVGIIMGVVLFEAGPGYLLIHFVEWILRKLHIKH